MVTSPTSWAGGLKKVRWLCKGLKMGMTIKQFNRTAFYNALEEYRKALREGTNLVMASVRVHAASGADGVTQNMQRMIGRAFRSNGQ